MAVCAEVESTTRDSAEQQWERLICQGGIRSTGSGARSPTFPHPERAVRSPGICGAMRGVSHCARWVSLRAPRAPTASGWDIGWATPKRRGPQSQDRAYARSQRPHPCGGWGWGWEGSPTSPCALGRKDGAPAGARGRRCRFHTPPSISAFPHCAPGEGIIQLYHPSAMQPFPLLLWNLGHFEGESPNSQNKYLITLKSNWVL